MLIYGINPVLEALRAKRVTAIRVSSRTDDRLAQVARLAEEQGLPVRRISDADLERLVGGPGQRHQGVAADVPEAGSYSAWVHAKWRDSCSNSCCLKTGNGAEATAGNDDVFNVVALNQVE